MGLIIPTKISIRNYDSTSGIKCISLSIGAGDGSWVVPCADIKGIQKPWNSDEQEFVLGGLCVSPRWIWKNNAKHIRMEVKENHGYAYGNVFYSFRLFGVPL